jgi:hypothetical protein
MDKKNIRLDLNEIETTHSLQYLPECNVRNFVADLFNYEQIKSLVTTQSVDSTKIEMTITLDNLDVYKFTFGLDKDQMKDYKKQYTFRTKDISNTHVFTIKKLISIGILSFDKIEYTTKAGVKYEKDFTKFSEFESILVTRPFFHGTFDKVGTKI